MKNPTPIKYDDGYAIRFTRRGGSILIWVQDLTGRKLKYCAVNRPVVVFPSKAEAEEEITKFVIPYIIENDKDVECIK